MTNLNNNITIIEARIEKLLESNISTERIANQTNHSIDEIENMRKNGIENSSYKIVKHLCNFIVQHDNEVADKAKRILADIKNGEEKDYRIDKFNPDTGNRHRISRVKLDDENYFYCVYTDNGIHSEQIDSRRNTDDEILEAIVNEIWDGTEIFKFSAKR